MIKIMWYMHITFLLFLFIVCGCINGTNNYRTHEVYNDKNVKFDFINKVVLNTEFDKTVYSMKDTMKIKFTFTNISLDTVNILPMGIFMFLLLSHLDHADECDYITMTMDDIQKGIYINKKVNCQVVETLHPGESVEISCKYSGYGELFEYDKKNIVKIIYSNGEISRVGDKEILVGGAVSNKVEFVIEKSTKSPIDF